MRCCARYRRSKCYILYHICNHILQLYLVEDHGKHSRRYPRWNNDAASQWSPCSNETRRESRVRGWCAVYSRRWKWVTAATTVARMNRGWKCIRVHRSQVKRAYLAEYFLSLLLLGHVLSFSLFNDVSLLSFPPTVSLFFPSIFEHQFSQPAFFTQSSFNISFRQVDCYWKFGVWAWMLARPFFSLDHFCLTVFSCLFFFYKILWYWSKSMLEAIEIPVSWSPFFNIGSRSLLSWNKFTEEPCESLLKSQNSSFVWLPLLSAHGCSDIFLSSPKSN